MIDPKLNEIPADPKHAGEHSKAYSGTSPRKGLSINETIAADANQSVGARGVNTSGVSSGSGDKSEKTFLNNSDTKPPATEK